MNKIFRFLTLAVVAVCSLSFASCGDDDDDDDNNNNTVVAPGAPTSVDEVSGNTWVLNVAKSSAYAEMNGIKGPTLITEGGANGVIPTAMTFYNDGTSAVDVSGVKSSGSYSIDGKEFSLTYNVVLNKTENGVESKVEKAFTLKKNADLSQALYDELGFSSDMMKNIFTQCQISKSGNHLVLSLTLTTTMSMGDDFDYSEMGQYGDFFNNMFNSKKYIAYTLVYDRK